jgi:thioredoxin-dependent peroxiredoxin
MIKENKLLKDFKLPSSNGEIFHLKKDLKQNLIIYIYPKDNTPGCTTESLDFSKDYKKFKNLNTDIIGVSKDDIETHLKFKKKNKLPFELLSDENAKFIKEVGAWGKKSMYGKNFMGIKRTTILIGKNRKIIKIWRNVKIQNHVKDVFIFIKENLN